MGDAGKEKIVHKFYKYLSKNLIWIVCIVVIILQFFQIVYFKGNIFTSDYDHTYWKERFEHSQWQLPLTQRMIGDDELYAYNGFALFHGTSPYTIVAHVPPLGKYLLGLSIVLFNNASYLPMIFGIGTLIFFYLIVKKLFFSSKKAILTVTFYFLDPLFFSQFWSWMLDVFQLFFLLATVYFFFSYTTLLKSHGRYFMLGLSAVFLACFSQIKVPILLPLLLIIEIGYLVFLRRFRHTLFFLFVFVVAFIIVNIQFFLDGGNIIEFLKFQKYVFAFYAQSQVNASYIGAWYALFLGKVPQIATDEIIRVREWTFIWPIVGFIGIVSSIFLVISKKIEYSWKFLGLFIVGSLLIFTAIPFYTRYLILIFPFLYLFFFRSVFYINTRKSTFIFLPFLLFGITNAFFFLQPSSSDTLTTFYHNFRNRYFQDIYVESLTRNSKNEYGLEKFNLTIQKTLNDMEVGAISIEQSSITIPQFSEVGSVSVHIIYKTRRLGKFEEDKVIRLRKENGEWKVVWDWNLVLNGFSPGDRIQANYISGERGTIKSTTGEIFAEDKEGILISVNPSLLDVKSENQTLKFLSEITGQQAVGLQAAYLDNPMNGGYIPIATVFTDMSEQQKDKLSKIEGIKLDKYSNRIEYSPLGGKLENSFYEECCSRIYSSYNFVGTSGYEMTFEKLLRGEDGGKIILIDRNGQTKRVLLKKIEKRGKDVVYY